MFEFDEELTTEHKLIGIGSVGCNVLENVVNLLGVPLESVLIDENSTKIKKIESREQLNYPYAMIAGNEKDVALALGVNLFKEWKSYSKTNYYVVIVVSFETMKSIEILKNYMVCLKLLNIVPIVVEVGKPVEGNNSIDYKLYGKVMNSREEYIGPVRAMSKRFTEGYKKVYNIEEQIVAALYNTMFFSGNMDHYDVKSVLSMGCSIKSGVGLGEGEDKILDAVKNAFSLENFSQLDLSRAKGCLVSFRGTLLSHFECQERCYHMIHGFLGEGCELIISQSDIGGVDDYLYCLVMISKN